MSNKEIKLRTKKREFAVYKDDGVVRCYKVVELDIFGSKKHFEGCGDACQTKGNSFNESFGKALAEVRAHQDIQHQLELALIKYSFDHMLEEPKDDFFREGVLESIDYPNVTINIGGGSQ